jgi:hypothetical protein
MRFLTRAWHSGTMSDAEAEAVADAYRRHLASIKAVLPAAVRALADNLNLHDARIRRVALDADAREVRLDLRCGDRARGYEDVALTYIDAELEPAAVAALRAATEDTATELLYDEVDLAGGRRFSHRFLFWPYREVEITYADVIAERAPVASREFALTQHRWVEI